MWGDSIHGTVSSHGMIRQLTAFYTGYIPMGNSYYELIEQITLVTGRMKALPRWTQLGAIIGLEGGSAEVRPRVRELLRHNVSVSAVWLQDWVGLRSAFDGDRLVWNWQLNRDHYPHWDELVEDLWEEGVRVLSYLNPFFSNPEGHVANISRNLFIEGILNDYFVKSRHGSPYLLRSGSIEFHMVDLTNPAARVWLKELIKDHMLRGTRVSGWMADFGEYLPFDAVLFNSSKDPALHHNEYPEEWARLNEEAVDEFEAEHRRADRSLWRRTVEGLRGLTRRASYRCVEDECGREVLYFLRSAWLRSPTYSRAFWIGDQMVVNAIAF